MSNGAKIDYNDILNQIKTELYSIINDDSFYANHDFLITLEQQFIKTRQMQPNRIYIVVKINSASVNYGQTILPVTIQVISEQNMLFTAQKLLFDFVEKYNLSRSADQTTQQIWQSPVVSTNFEQMFEGFRSVLYVSGTLVISKNANFCTLSYNVPTLESSSTSTGFEYEINKTKAFQRLYQENSNSITQEQTVVVAYNGTGGEWSINGENITIEKMNKYGYTNLETFMSDFYGITRKSADSIPGTINISLSFTPKQMDVLGLTFSGDSQLDPQVFYNTHNFTESIARVGTITLGLSSFLFSDNDLMNTCMGIQLKDVNTYPLGINTTFKLTIGFKSGLSLTDNFKMASLSMQQNLGDIPSVSLTFTN